MFYLKTAVSIGYVIFAAAFTNLQAQTMTLSLSSSDFEVFPAFSDVNNFAFDIEIDAPLAAGMYVDPPIVSINYEVSGTLEQGTPSGFPAFVLVRPTADQVMAGVVLDGDEFYAQGSSLSFEISESAELSDGVQVDELVGTNVVFRFDGREEDNGRFHPPLLELNSDGSGSIQNSDNIPDITQPAVEIGAEYITDFIFDPGNLTLITETSTTTEPTDNDSGGGSISWFFFSILLLIGLARRRGLFSKN